MAERDLVVVGGSAGALEALTTILSALPPSFGACVLVVIHTRASPDGMLASILGRHAALPVALATEGTPLQPGRVYVAPPDYQLLVEGDRLALTRGPRENGFRPAIDPLFRTAARWRGSRVVGVVLSGALDDGTYGLRQIKRHGGLAIVQHPEDAVMPSMPASALRHVQVDDVLAAAEIAPRLGELVAHSHARDTLAPASQEEPETQRPEEQTEVRDLEAALGPPSSLTCPDCGGALWQIQQGKLVRYRCHVGHQYAQDSLAAEQRDAVEGALWSAVRILEEQAELKRRMAARAEAAGLSVVHEGFAQGARNSHRQAQEIRAILFASDSVPLGRDSVPAALEAEPVRRRAPARSIRRSKRSR